MSSEKQNADVLIPASAVLDGGCPLGAHSCDLTTGDMARLTGSTVRTVRFYEEAGLLEPTQRRCGGHRLYDKSALARLELILDLREAGLSLNDIKALFALKATCPSARDASHRMAAILEKQIIALQTKIQKLRTLRDELSASIGILGECRQCDEPAFPRVCGECEVVDRDDLPRAVKVLWK